MKKKTLPFFASICFWLLNISQVFSQSKDTIAPSIINATGGSKVYNNITYEWSIGEALITDAMSSGNIVVTNGILQPAAAGSAIRYDHNNEWSSDEIRIYPIPSNNWITISFLSIETGQLNMRLWDAAHKLMYIRQFNYSGGSHVEMINVSHYASGNYFLKIDLVIDILGPSIQKYGTYKIQIVR